MAQRHSCLNPSGLILHHTSPPGTSPLKTSPVQKTVSTRRLTAATHSVGTQDDQSATSTPPTSPRYLRSQRWLRVCDRKPRRCSRSTTGLRLNHSKTCRRLRPSCDHPSPARGQGGEDRHSLVCPYHRPRTHALLPMARATEYPH